MIRFAFLIAFACSLNQSIKPYKIEKAKIKYAVRSNSSFFTDTLIRTFCNYGRKEIITNSSKSGLPFKLIMLDSIQYYLVDDKQVIKSKREFEFSMRNFSVDLKRMGKSKKYLIEPDGNDTLLSLVVTGSNLKKPMKPSVAYFLSGIIFL